MLQDKNPARISACPVHFIWDGRGRGRTLVRAGFLGFLAMFIALTGAIVFRLDEIHTLAMTIGAVALISWSIGQVLSYFEARQYKASLAAARFEK